MAIINIIESEIRNKVDQVFLRLQYCVYMIKWVRRLSIYVEHNVDDEQTKFIRSCQRVLLDSFVHVVEKLCSRVLESFYDSKVSSRNQRSSVKTSVSSRNSSRLYLLYLLVHMSCNNWPKDGSKRFIILYLASQSSWLASSLESVKKFKKTGCKINA